MRKLFWPAYFVYAIITGVNSFIVPVPKIIYLPVIGVCLICFLICLIMQIIDVRNEQKKKTKKKTIK